MPPLICPGKGKDGLRGWPVGLDTAGGPQRGTGLGGTGPAIHAVLWKPSLPAGSASSPL